MEPEEIKPRQLGCDLHQRSDRPVVSILLPVFAILPLREGDATQQPCEADIVKAIGSEVFRSCSLECFVRSSWKKWHSSHQIRSEVNKKGIRLLFNLLRSAQKMPPKGHDKCVTVCCTNFHSRKSHSYATPSADFTVSSTSQDHQNIFHPSPLSIVLGV